MEQCFLETKVGRIHDLNVDPFGTEEFYQGACSISIWSDDKPFNHTRCGGSFISRRTFIWKHSPHKPRAVTVTEARIFCPRRSQFRDKYGDAAEGGYGNVLPQQILPPEKPRKGENR
jgi:hypothetical protein